MALQNYQKTGEFSNFARQNKVALPKGTVTINKRGGQKASDVAAAKMEPLKDLSDGKKDNRKPNWASFDQGSNS